MPVLFRVLALLGLCLAAACTKPVVFAPDDAVQTARYRHAGPPEIVLFNIVSNERGSGVHAALMINASERVLFDPAGTWMHAQAPEQHDVHFGFNAGQLHRYTYYHASRLHHVVKHRLELSPEMAETILLLARRYGPVPDGQCAVSIGRILGQVPGFESIPVTYSPNRLSAAFAQLPGVVEERIYSDAEPTPIIRPGQ
jgi:hypothetical protein